MRADTRGAAAVSARCPIILPALKLPWETPAIAALLTGFGDRLFNTLWETALQQRIPLASLSRVGADDWFARPTRHGATRVC
jgi:hypothetical protein